MFKIQDALVSVLANKKIKNKNPNVYCLKVQSFNLISAGHTVLSSNLFKTTR